MVSIRPASREAEPHLDLGLYMVRLIAAFHGGEATASDREGGDGVRVAVTIPLDTGGFPGDDASRAPTNA